MEKDTYHTKEINNVKIYFSSVGSPCMKINTKCSEGRAANAVAWVLTPLLCCLAT